MLLLLERWVKESLRKTIKALGKKYGQDSVLTQTKKNWYTTVQQGKKV